MRFSAYLRQPFDVPQEEKDAYVEEMIELLELAGTFRSFSVQS